MDIPEFLLHMSEPQIKFPYFENVVNLQDSSHYIVKIIDSDR